MTGQIIEFIEKPRGHRVAHYGYSCPDCGGNDGYLNIGRDHWFFCERHRVKWWAGSNLMSTWHEETEADWARNREKLAGYCDLSDCSPEAM